jgi:hypothetical protein
MRSYEAVKLVAIINNNIKVIWFSNFTSYNVQKFKDKASELAGVLADWEVEGFDELPYRVIAYNWENC